MKTKSHNYDKVDYICERIDFGFIIIMLSAVALTLLGGLVWAIFSAEGPVWPIIGFFGILIGLPFLSYWVGKWFIG